MHLDVNHLVETVFIFVSTALCKMFILNLASLSLPHHLVPLFRLTKNKIFLNSMSVLYPREMFLSFFPIHFCKFQKLLLYLRLTPYM